ncbi:MAG: hypothetical protein E7530_05990 [Ruminococcaceae bacterium]|nr:hypothetical protein [Oscillospiraceae bacterium]
MVNQRFCTVCGKEKEQKQTGFGSICIYIECECEKKLREEKEKKDSDYALKTAVELRNQNSHLTSLGSKASFKTAVTDKYNEVAVRGGKYLLNQLLNDKNHDKKNGLVLQGNRGSGKTYISCAVINDFNSQLPLSDEQKKQIIKERNNGFSFKDYTPVKSPCKFITETDLFALYYDDFNYRKTNSPVEEFKRAKKLLVIDDAGTLTYEKDRVQAMYLNIIDYRYSEGLSTILTTNLKKQELDEYLGDRVFDRLNSCCYFLDLISPESRRNVNS